MTDTNRNRDQPGAAPVSIELGLNAAIVSLHADQPQILTVGPETKSDRKFEALPFGPFTPLQHRTLEIGLREWVRRQTGLELGYVEQLYTFGDRGRHARAGDLKPHGVSVGYLALTRTGSGDPVGDARWRSWYWFFPWEDWRGGQPAILAREVVPRLHEWVDDPAPDRGDAGRAGRRERVQLNFGLDGVDWDEERVLERYELLYEAGLLAEAARDGRQAAKRWRTSPKLGRPMQLDHRRILATAMGRLRGKLKYRPVVFELMPERFTLFELQKRVEAISGTRLHKQNFRRLVAATGLVEDTGQMSTATGGRPAKLYRFRREAQLEHAAPGLRVRASRVS